MPPMMAYQFLERWLNTPYYAEELIGVILEAKVKVRELTRLSNKF